MSESIVCHLYLAEASVGAYSPDQLSVVLRVVTKGEQNKTWAAATPSGELKLSIKNPAATGIFRSSEQASGIDLNAEYEVVITRLPGKGGDGFPPAA